MSLCVSVCMLKISEKVFNQSTPISGHPCLPSMKTFDFEKNHRVRVGVGVLRFWPNDKRQGKMFQCL